MVVAMTSAVSLAVIRSFSHERSVFLLSEIRARIPGEPPLEVLYLEIVPHLSELGLVARKAGDDYEISRDTSPGVLVLDDEERAAIDSYLQCTIAASSPGEPGRGLYREEDRKTLG